MVPKVMTANAYSILADDSPDSDPNLLDTEEMEAKFPTLLERLYARRERI